MMVSLGLENMETMSKADFMEFVKVRKLSNFIVTLAHISRAFGWKSLVVLVWFAFRYEYTLALNCNTGHEHGLFIIFM